TVNLPESSARLLALAMKEGIETAFTSELIRSNSLACPDPEMENWPWQVKVRALGPFEVWKDGEKIQSARKARQKPFELLKAVITLGCRNVSERAVADMLWPEAEGDAAHSAFATTLHRLRQLLGFEGFLELKNGKLALDSRCCWVDAWAFEAALKRAEASLKAGAVQKALGEIDAAFGLYGGDFLSSDAETPWTVQARDKLKERFCRVILAASEVLLASGKTAQAVEYLSSGLTVDPSAEGLCQRLLEINVRSGRRAEALALYQKLKESMAQKHGLEPAPATKAIIESFFRK
ncbi:partial Regulatory protein AfsR, partial [Anaerolineae bacterium]